MRGVPTVPWSRLPVMPSSLTRRDVCASTEHLNLILVIFTIVSFI